MGVFKFQPQLMAALIVTFLLLALGAPQMLRFSGHGKALPTAFDSKGEGLSKINAGREGNLHTDKRQVSLGITFRLRSLTVRRLPSPFTANRKKVTAKAFASPPKNIHYHLH